MLLCVKKERGYGFNLLVPCFVLLYTSTFFLCFVSGGFNWWGDEERGGGWKLSNFCTYMDYLYCMPKWSHSRFYEIKLLINISIYWYIKFIKTVQLLVFGVFCLFACLFYLCVASGSKIPGCPAASVHILQKENWHAFQVVATHNP